MTENGAKLFNVVSAKEKERKKGRRKNVKNVAACGKAKVADSWTLYHIRYSHCALHPSFVLNDDTNEEARKKRRKITLTHFNDLAVHLFSNNLVEIYYVLIWELRNGSSREKKNHKFISQFQVTHQSYISKMHSDDKSFALFQLDWWWKCHQFRREKFC